MSMPRAAISVATSTLVSPALKPSSAATRADWLLLPWMAAAGMPCLFRSLAILSAPCLVRLKTSAFCTGGFRFWMSQGSRNFLLPFSTKYRLWSMRSTVLDTGSTLTKAGSCRIPAASCSISLGMVALNIRFWRWAGSLAMTFFTSCTKPMSSIRSASSSTKISMWERSMRPCPTRSFRRPGQAMRISTPFLRAATCGAWPTPPKITVLRWFRYLPYSSKLSPICSASSRVGVRIRARTAPFFLAGAAVRRSSMGSAKAAVLPVPVWAQPIKSLPASTGGMADA